MSGGVGREMFGLKKVVKTSIVTSKGVPGSFSTRYIGDFHSSHLNPYYWVDDVDDFIPYYMEIMGV